MFEIAASRFADGCISCRCADVLQHVCGHAVVQSQISSSSHSTLHLQDLALATIQRFSMVLQHTLSVCILCRTSQPTEKNLQPPPGQLLYEQLLTNSALNRLPPSESRENGSLQILPVRCFGACSVGCIAAFMAPGKLTFVLKGLNVTDSIPDLLRFADQYQQAPAGRVPYQERPEAVRQGIHAVIPPLPIST